MTRDATHVVGRGQTGAIQVAIELLSVDADIAANL